MICDLEGSFSLTFLICIFGSQQKSLAISKTLHCNLKVRWKVASDLRFRAAMSEPETPSFCGISGDLAPSTQKSLAIAIVRFWCACHFCGFRDFR